MVSKPNKVDARPKANPTRSMQAPKSNSGDHDSGGSSNRHDTAVRPRLGPFAYTQVIWWRSPRSISDVGVASDDSLASTCSNEKKSELLTIGEQGRRGFGKF